MEAKAVDHLHPDWNVGLDEADSREGAFALDAASATHPIVQAKDTTAETNEIGDAITYEKGAAVVRMLEAYVGPDNWREGVRAYMKEHAYANTTHDDLYRAMEAAAHKPVMQIARDFTLQAGAPLIAVDAVTPAAGGSTVTLHQGRFGLDAPSKAPKTWHVPVNLLAANGATAQAVIAGPQPQTVALPGPSQSSPTRGDRLLPHALRAGRVPAACGRAGALGPYDQLVLIRDSWALADGGYAPAGEMLTLATRLPTDADPLVWNALADELTSIDLLYEGLPERQAAFRAFGRRVLGPQMAKLGWEPKPGEPAGAKVARETVIGALSVFDDPAVIAEARRRFALFQKDPSSLPAGIRDPVLNAVGLHADAADFEALRALARASTDAQEKEQFLYSLARVRDPALSAKLMDLSLTPEVPPSLAPVLLRIAAGRHPQAAYAFGLAPQGAARRGVRHAQPPQHDPGLARTSSDPAMADAVHAFARTAPAAGRSTSGGQGRGRIRHRADVRARVLPEVDAWIAANPQGVKA
ncbi:MAG: M1 family metallopeptidase [Caulobacteraceae bacterium]